MCGDMDRGCASLVRINKDIYVEKGQSKHLQLQFPKYNFFYQHYESNCIGRNESAVQLLLANYEIKSDTFLKNI